MQVIDDSGITMGAPGVEQTSSILSSQIGTRLQLFTRRDIKPVQHFSTLIGYLKGEYIICKTPTIDNVSIPFNNGEKVSIRGFTGTNIFSFDTSVIRTFSHPLLYMHLYFPYEIKNVGLRRAARIKVNIPAQISVLHPGEPALILDAWLTNLSLTGAALESPHNLGEEQLLQLSFIFEYRGEETKINTGALVRNVTRRFTAGSEDQDTYVYGVEFLSLDPKEEMQLKLFVYEFLLINRQSVT